MIRLILLTIALTATVAGAATSIRLASDPELEGVTGKYYDVYRSGAKPGGSPVPSAGSPSSYDEAAAKRLWRCNPLSARYLPKFFSLICRY